MSSLVERVQTVRTKMWKEIWEAYSETDRFGASAAIFEDDFQANGNTFVRDVFTRARRDLFPESRYRLDFDYAQLMAIFDLCERYAKNWAFA